MMLQNQNFSNALLTDKGNIPYGKLIIALGHSQEIKTIEGSQYLHKLETIEDAIGMREHMLEPVSEQEMEE